jgi:hypothetical protein
VLVAATTGRSKVKTIVYYRHRASQSWRATQWHLWRSLKFRLQIANPNRKSKISPGS